MLRMFCLFPSYCANHDVILALVFFAEILIIEKRVCR